MCESKTEKRRQIISIVICWLAVTCMYPGRNSYSAAITLIEEDYGVSHAQAGLVMTLFFAAYGITQVFHGFFCKRYNKKFIVPLALAASALVNFSLTFGVPFYLIKYLWLLNAVCQSLVWPTALQVISENVGAKYMRAAMFCVATTTPVGKLAIYGISGAFAGGNYRLTFLTGALILFAAAAIWLFGYKKGDYLEKTAAAEEKTEKKVPGVYLYLPIALFFLFSMVMFFLNDGLQSFAPAILREMHNMPDSISIWLAMTVPLLGAFGSPFGVFLNKYVKKLIILELMLFGVLTALDVILLLYGYILPVMLLTLGAMGLLFHAAICVITTVFPLSMRSKMSSGALTGILNGGAYLGSAAGTYALGAVADKSGWNVVFAMLAVIMAVTAAVGVVYWFAGAKHKELRV